MIARSRDYLIGPMIARSGELEKNHEVENQRRKRMV